MSAGTGYSFTKVFSLGAVDTKQEVLEYSRTSCFFSAHNLFLHMLIIFNYYVAQIFQTSPALLSWCNGCIATLTKLPVRVQFPSTAPQPRVLKTDLLVLIVKLGKLSRSLEETRGSFTLYAQLPRQPHQSLMQPLELQLAILNAGNFLRFGSTPVSPMPSI